MRALRAALRARIRHRLLWYLASARLPDGKGSPHPSHSRTDDSSALAVNGSASPEPGSTRSSPSDATTVSSYSSVFGALTGRDAASSWSGSTSGLPNRRSGGIEVTSNGSCRRTWVTNRWLRSATSLAGVSP